MKPLFPTASSENLSSLRVETNEMLVAKSEASIYGQLVLTVIAGFAIGWDELRAVEAITVVALLALNTIRMLHNQGHFVDRHENENTWFYVYSTLTLMTAVLWVGTVIEQTLYHSLEFDITVVLFLMCAGVGAGATASLSPHKPLANTFIVTILAPIVIFFAIGPLAQISISLVTMAYIVFLLTQVKIHHGILWELKNKQEQLRAIVDATMEPILVHENGKIIAANPALLRLFKYSLEEIKGLNVSQLIAPDYHALVREHISKNSTTPLEIVGIKRDGTEFPLAGYGQWFHYEGRLARVACYQDLTTRKQAENALIESVQQKQLLAEEKERAATESAKLKGEFLANMSHEIRTPLNAIIGITDILSETPANDRQKRYLRLLKESGESLLSLINDILDFSKIDADKLELEQINFSVSGVVEGQAELLAGRARQKGVSIHTSLDPQLPTGVYGDYGRIGQILLNLVNNAIKFTRNGHVWVRASVVNRRDGAIRVRFEVQDSGIGISDSIGSKLFKPFTQADSSTARKHGGTGLGLSISKRLIELMNGEIGYISQIGVGTTFWFEVPFEVTDPRTLSQTYMRKDWSHLECIVITDDLYSHEVIHRYLNSWQLSAKTSALRDLALSIGESQRSPDLLVVSSGAAAEELLEFANQLPSLRRTFKIVQIEYGDPEHIQRSLHDPHGLVSTTLPVPVRQSDLFNAIVNTLIRSPNEDLIKESVPQETKMSPIAGLRVLVAEDNSTNQLIILRILRNLGVNAHAVGNGAEAIQALAANPYDLVLMDCQMPEMDGFEATKKIRERELTSKTHIPIVALTANVLKEERDRCFECGMDDFLAKPVRKEKLVESLNSQMVKSRAVA